MKLKFILEAALFSAGRTLTLADLQALFDEDLQPSRDELKSALNQLEQDYLEKCLELKQVASGYRFQVRSEYSEWVARLFEEKPGRYTRAFLETLAIIAYRQPVTRGEIEEIRGVAVNTNIVRNLMERGWIDVIGHKDVPGKPALLGTTTDFLDYFNLKDLTELPPIQEFMEQQIPSSEIPDTPINDNQDSMQSADLSSDNQA